MDSNSATTTIEMEARDLPAKTVIVYADRAEVKRQIEVDLPGRGSYTILVQVGGGVSAQMEPWRVTHLF